MGTRYILIILEISEYHKIDDMKIHSRQVFFFNSMINNNNINSNLLSFIKIKAIRKFIFDQFIFF